VLLPVRVAGGDARDQKSSTNPPTQARSSAVAHSRPMLVPTQAMWWQNIKMMLTLGGAGLALVVFFVWWKCGLSLSHCRAAAAKAAA